MAKKNKKWSVCDGLSAVAASSVLTSGVVAGVGEVAEDAAASALRTASQIKISLNPPLEEVEVLGSQYDPDPFSYNLYFASVQVDLAIANSNERILLYFSLLKHVERDHDLRISDRKQTHKSYT